MKVHRLLRALVQPRFDTRRERWQKREDVFALVTRKRRQDEIGEILVNASPLLARPYADTKTRVFLTAERMLDALQSVVAAGTSPGANPEATHGDLQFVDDNQKILGGAPERASRVILQRLPAEVHERLRLDQLDFYIGDDAACRVRITVFFPAVKMPNVGEVVDQPPADVVPCRGVLAARIPETDYDLQGLSNSGGQSPYMNVRSYYFLPGDSPPFLAGAGDSPPPSPSSSSPRPLPMTSGSGAPSTPPSPAPAAGAPPLHARGGAS